MEVDDGGAEHLPPHNHKEGFRCSSESCNWATINVGNFRMHLRRNHRHDVLPPKLLPAWVIPINPSRTQKRYRAFCLTEPGDRATDRNYSSTDHQAGDGSGAGDNDDSSNRRKRQRLSSMPPEQANAQCLGINVLTSSVIMNSGRDDADHVEQPGPNNSNVLNLFYRKVRWFTEDDPIMKNTKYEKRRDMLFYLSRRPQKGI
jgi:hypothetical protein